MTPAILALKRGDTFATRSVTIAVLILFTAFLNWPNLSVVF
jgi:hypothetical protein